MRIPHKVFFVLAFFLKCTTLVGQTSQNMTLLDRWFQDSLLTNSSKVRYNDCFGFVWKGQEYAVAGSTEGTHVFLIGDDDHFHPVGFLKGRYSSSTVSHRDYFTYQHYLYAVCDEGVSSLQIIDYQYLPDSIHLAQEDSIQFGRVHNIYIDSAQAKFYSLIHRSTVNTQTIASPMKIFSLADPLNLVELWSGPDDVAEVHDAFVINGKALLNCGYDGLRVYDFTNTASPDYLDSKTFYQDQGYNHQGWLTPSGNTYFFADETNGKRVKKCSFDGSHVTIQSLFGTNFLNQSVPHNIMATDTFVYVAYYNEGLHVYDMRYTIPTEIAHYDTYPDNTSFKQNGNWGLFTLLPSKRILASDRQYGLFLLDFDQDLFKTTTVNETPVLYPNPLGAGETITVRMPIHSSGISYELSDCLGRIVFSGSVTAQDYFTFTPLLAAASYQLRIRYSDAKGNDATYITSIVLL